MPKIRELRKVDAEYATTGPNRNVIRQPIAVPASVLFNCLVDGPAWSEWLGIEVEWTSPEPFGVGTTRTVTTNGQIIDEQFLAWEEGRRMNFRFERSTLPVAAFAEDYLVEAHGDHKCELIWSYAYEWDGPLAMVTSKVFGAGFAFKGRQSLKKLQALLESDPERFASST